MAPDFLHRRQADRDDTSRPVLITAARESYQDELAARKKRYFLLMSIRIPALLLAAWSLSLWHNPWIALAIVGISIPIPWIAVIGANDRPPLSKEEARTYHPRSLAMPTGRELPPGIRGETRAEGQADHRARAEGQANNHTRAEEQAEGQADDRARTDTHHTHDTHEDGRPR